MTTIENNKLLAEFIGTEVGVDMYFLETSKRYVSKNDLVFSSDWNLLMEVVDKIEMMRFQTKKPNLVEFADYTITWEYRELGWKAYWFTMMCTDDILNYLKEGEDELVYFKTKIKAVYNACIEFVKWYNNEKNK